MRNSLIIQALADKYPKGLHELEIELWGGLEYPQSDAKEEMKPDRFMVRYEKNQSFTGRDTFLAQLHDKFQNPGTDPYHGRIALFRLGGIRKTQIALEYAYRYQSSYRRIYWISADTQASLLDGYQKIAERAELQILHPLTAVEVAERVLVTGVSGTGCSDSGSRWIKLLQAKENLRAV